MNLGHRLCSESVSEPEENLQAGFMCDVWLISSSAIYMKLFYSATVLVRTIRTFKYLSFLLMLMFC